MNLSAPSSNTTNVQAELDNSFAHNSSSYIANPPFHLLAAGYMHSVSVQGVDVEGDSLVYEMYQPLAGSFPTSSPVPYNTGGGFSVTDPLGAGGTATVSSSTQSMQLMAPLMGKFNLAFKVTEYRNGVEIGSSARDFQVLSLNGSAAVTTPAPTTTTPMFYVTCPGQSHTITLNFADDPADSVFLNITTPSMPGFSFTPTITPGLGGASATISWTTPASMNPATLPYFYIMVEAYDNTCPGTNSGYYAVAVQTAQCNTDSVWAGDANGDWTVNNYDPLAISVAYGATGTPRPGATTTWQAEYCPDWTTNFMNNVNHKHADCNGDGTVDNLDLGAVTANWGQVHFKGGPRAKTTSVPDLSFDITGMTFTPGATVAVPIRLGTPTYPMNDFYGLATEINVTGVGITAPPTVTYPPTWMANSTNSLRFTHTDAANPEELSWVYARIDHQNVSGQGTIAMLHFTIPATATPGQMLHLNFANTRIIDKDMVELTAYNILDVSVLVSPLSVGNVNAAITNAQVLPNPSGAQANLQLHAAQNGSVSVSVKDITGKVVSRQRINAVRGANTIALPASEISSGIYLIHLTDGSGYQQNIKWIKQ
jgi:hypothetical protein